MKTKVFASFLMAFLLLFAALNAGSAESAGGCPSQTAIEENEGRHRYIMIGRVDSCTENGYILFTCAYCGASYREDVPPADHAWAESGRTEPDCEKAGRIDFTCSRCGATRSEELSPLGHDYQLTSYKEAECETGGWKVYTCSRCGAEKKEETEPRGHAFTNWEAVTPGTCQQKEILAHTCVRCKKTVQKSNGYGLHAWGEWHVIREPIGEEAGLRQRECTLCHAVQQDRFISYSDPDPEEPVSVGENAASERLMLTLYAAAQFPRESYELDMIGMTEYIPYLLTVINSGFSDCMVSGFNVSVRGVETAYPLEPQLLSPGQSLSFIYSHKFSREDLTEAQNSENGLGYAVISFRTFAYSAENAEETFSSNEAFLSHFIAGQKTAFSAVQEQSASYIQLSAVPDAQGAPFHAGDEIHYSIHLTNQSNRALNSVTLHQLFGEADEKARYAAMVYDVAPGAAKETECIYTVTANDEARGFAFLLPSASWIDPESGNLITCRAMPWTVSVEKREAYAAAAPQLTVQTTSVSQNGAYYTEDDMIVFTVEFANTTEGDILNLSLETLLPSGERQAWAVSPRLIPGGSETVIIPYTVTTREALSGSVSMLAFARFTGDKDDTLMIESSESVPCGPAIQTSGVTVALRTVGAPSDGVAFRYGETIACEIQVTNDSDAPVRQVQVFLSPEKTDPIEEAEALQPGEKLSFTFAHTVTAEEAQAGSVAFSAFAVYETDDEGLAYAEAEAPLSCATRADVDYSAGFTDLTLPLAASENDGCLRTLTVKGSGASEYTRHYCARHASIVNLARSLTEQADDPAAGWRQAASLWEDEMEALYQQYMDAAHGTARTAIMKERLAFLQYCADYEALLLLSRPDQPEYAAKRAAEMLMLRVFELCDGLHHAGEDRMDSVVTGSYARIITTGAPNRCGSISMASQNDDAYYREQLCGTHAALEEYADQLLAGDSDLNQTLDTVAVLWRNAWQAEMDEFTAEDAQLQAALGRLAASAPQYVSARAEVLSLLYPRSAQTASEVLSQNLKEMTMTFCQDMR